jgi:eukaryotic-like serine/threonine-protein kinase
MPFDPARAKALFLAALERPDPAERACFLDRECGEDADLRHRVEQLLAAYDQPAAAPEIPRKSGPTLATEINLDPGPTDIFAHRPPIEGERTASLAEEAAPRDLIGTIIAGRYKLRQEIGEGGMGSVYLADQTQPVRRQVALKLIKPGMDSRTVLARFESERQALALMDHPHIARVLDAGSTEHGRPFFVMELVRGIPLTEYCDRHQIDLPTRLAIFRQICSAVQHAHQKGIIHRDLKPTNILVENQDGKPVPKVIDFGLAKATSGLKLTEKSLYTAFGGVAGTPLYMAPEQAGLNALDVDTRADIYALGAILYELLTGSTPIRRETFQNAALDEMLRVIREDEPPTPSNRLSTSDALPSLAAKRHTDPARLGRFVRGDLDWIVMKALSKERQRRYESAIELANDLERFTNQEPVSAGPPSTSYRLRKFVRRNRPLVFATSLLLLALLSGIVGSSLGLFEARRQEREAKRQEGIAVAEANEREKARQAEVVQRQLAEQRLAKLDKATSIFSSIFKDLIEVKGHGALEAVLGERLDRAMAGIEAEAIGDPLTLARMQQNLGISQLGLGYPQKAVDLLTKAKNTFAATLGPDHPDTLASRDDLALGYLATYQFDRSRALEEETLALRKAKLGPDHPDTLASMNRVATDYRAAGQIDRALPLLEETLALRKAKLGPDHPDTLHSMIELATGYQAARQFDRALPLFEQTLALTKARFGPDSSATVVSMGCLAFCQEAASQLDLALRLFEQTFSLAKARMGMDHPYTLVIMNSLANCNLAAGRFDHAIPLLRELAFHRKQEVGADSSSYAGVLASLGQSLSQEKEWAEGEATLREALAIRELKEPDLWQTFNTKSLLGGALLGQKKYVEAEPLLRAGFEGMKRRIEMIPPQDKIRFVEALDRLIELAETTGKVDEVAAWKANRAKLTAEAPKTEAKKP